VAITLDKPQVVCADMAEAKEIAEAIEAARERGCKELAILHCVSGYPAPAEDYNLGTIPDMVERFGLVTGLSDHTLDNTTAISSVGLGASIIEKHFTLERSGGGPDDSFSLEPAELAALCDGAKTAWAAMGRVNYGCKSSVLGNVKFRRSLYFVKALKAGDVITIDCVRSVRPGYVFPPKFYERLLGQTVLESVSAGTPVSFRQLS
jgi:sialic acid synthase SpsE